MGVKMQLAKQNRRLPSGHKFQINWHTQLQRRTMEMKTLRIRHFVPASVERALRERKGKCIRNGNSSRETLDGAKYDYDYPRKKVGDGGQARWGKQFVECEQQVSSKNEGPFASSTPQGAWPETNYRN